VMASRKLSEVAKTIRSKNAGVDKLTFDVIFSDRETYDWVRGSGPPTNDQAKKSGAVTPRDTL